MPISETCIGWGMEEVNVISGQVYLIKRYGVVVAMLLIDPAWEAKDVSIRGRI
jgi:hypothetical protein